MRVSETTKLALFTLKSSNEVSFLARILCYDIFEIVIDYMSSFCNTDLLYVTLVLRIIQPCNCRFSEIIKHVK